MELIARDSGLYINKLCLLEMKPGAVTFYIKNVHVIKLLTEGSIICLAIRVNVLRLTTDFCEGLISLVSATYKGFVYVPHFTSY
jgi:hypothetical protein